MKGKKKFKSWDDLLALHPESLLIEYDEKEQTKVIHEYVIEDESAGSHTFVFDITSAQKCLTKQWEESLHSVPLKITFSDNGQESELTAEEVNEEISFLAHMYSSHVLIFLLKEIHPAMEKAFHATFHVATDRAIRHISERMKTPLRAFGTPTEAINDIYQGLGKQIKEHLGITPGGSEKKVVATDMQAKTFAQDYPAILKHWQNIKGWRKKHPERWREHAKVEYPDTPDDLLDLLESGGSYESAPYRLAHHHAARRASIQTEIKRHDKLKLCSYETLNTILKYGKKLL